MTGNKKTLDKAKKAKCDEFYTQYSDIEDEMTLHKSFFKDKVVYLPCDDWEKSQFVRFFLDHFDEYGLKSLMSTSYAYANEEGRDLFNSEVKRGKVLVKTFDNTHYGLLEGDGDFRSDECEDFFNKADVIITNPPFSLFKDFFVCLKKCNKDFLILGPQNAITYKEVFPLAKEGKLWYSPPIKGGTFFIVPDNYDLKDSTCVKIDKKGKRLVRIAGVRWFTNFDRLEKAYPSFSRFYSEKEYPKYDNCNAINVNRACDVPFDYNEVMGVPINFFDRYDPSQFEIVGHLSTPFLNGKAIFKRLLIKRRCPNEISKKAS